MKFAVVLVAALARTKKPGTSTLATENWEQEAETEDENREDAEARDATASNSSNKLNVGGRRDGHSGRREDGSRGRDRWGRR